jgi:hypothetical protein
VASVDPEFGNAAMFGLRLRWHEDTQIHDPRSHLFAVFSSRCKSKAGSHALCLIRERGRGGIQDHDVAGVTFDADRQLDRDLDATASFGDEVRVHGNRLLDDLGRLNSWRGLCVAPTAVGGLLGLVGG